MVGDHEDGVGTESGGAGVIVGEDIGDLVGDGGSDDRGAGASVNLCSRVDGGDWGE